MSQRESEAGTPEAALVEALRAHDAAIEARGGGLWLGGEPTFTDRHSSEPCWNGGALGGDKRERGLQVAAALAAAHPGAVFLRTLGRQYPGESAPRWSFGVYRRRDGAAVWRGPLDPACGGGSSSEAQAAALRDAVAARLGGRSFRCAQSLPERLVLGEVADDDPALARAPAGTVALGDAGPTDTLAERGALLFCFGVIDGAAQVDLPAADSVERFLGWLSEIAAAASEIGLAGLRLGGAPPPVDDSVWSATITPDPGVLEINGAPESSLVAYHQQLRWTYGAAAAVGLEPARLFFNGDVAPSGGGGHVTFGGPAPERSPFFRAPMLLPRLLAYANRHPALSYWFAPECVGSSSQSPRPDEVARESFDELGVALELLSRLEAPTPADLWTALAPFLADRFGNTHRTEINAEKLWNPYLPLRGRLGLVEMRALRMPPDAERAAAIAALLRALLAYLSTSEVSLELRDWGAELHDRFALPHFQRVDLDAVLGELAAAGLGLGEPLRRALRDDAHLLVGELALPAGATLRLRWAREFWPLMSDDNQPEQSSRLIDASCARLELTITSAGAMDPERAPALVVGGYRVPWGRDGDTLVRALRFRRFVPGRGLHPHVPALDPLLFDVGEQRLALHGWRPGGGSYDGLPADLAEAARRRAERFVVSARPDAPAPVPVPRSALSPWTVDLRRLPPTSGRAAEPSES
ncbi:transglutaminase family protein [Haliangium ochraceum]|uniref:DUF2126 domain-containing protein n=1 Tax=Haliangium ochraceum (strain DSM 14365 / JCM 11303 / SMP-2) TaxID=502025 RepID=D0LFZ5_HALO1|nr:transglutaminase family protein [Haliangium ochraceum]ACY14597.1 Protein of unknown function DUF2126 [Haliangium ochraceum DSM 14365]